MIAIRLAEAEGTVDRARLSHDIFSEQYLIKRPLLQALEPDTAGPPVLLIDELDRTDEAFEAFLLEVLADFQVTVPEMGTVKAAHPPLVVITSNRTREIHDALKLKQYLPAQRLHHMHAPGVAETLDWAAALVELDAVALDPATVSDTLSVLLKYQDDIARIQGSKVQALIDQMRAELKAAANPSSAYRHQGRSGWVRVIHRSNV